MTPDLFDREPFERRFDQRAKADAVPRDGMSQAQVIKPSAAGSPSIFTRRGDSIVPPTSEELAKAARDRGMHRAAEHAGKEWQDQAVGFVRRYARVYRTMMAEDVRAMAEANGLAAPPTKKAWGPVMQRAAREGIVKADGIRAGEVVEPLA